MVTGLLICSIGIIPIVLALSMNSFYKESKLSKILGFNMILITIWQFDVGVLYFKDFLSKETILFLFKLFRFGPTFEIPIIYYVAFTIVKDQPAFLNTNKWFYLVYKLLFSKKAFYSLLVWSVFVFIINWTPLSIKGLHIAHLNYSSVDYYFPDYGPLFWIYIFHICSLILYIFLVFVISDRIQNQNIQKFLKSFNIYSSLLLISAVLNFSANTGIITGSIGVVIFSSLIVREFIKLNTNMKSNYYLLMERQKKLDYTGNLAGSLIHEVKNTNEIIKGFANMLNKSGMSERDQGSLEMIQRSSEHLNGLADNYKDYMKLSKMAFKREKLEEIIQDAIDFSQGIARDKEVKIEFINPYKSLNVYANKTNLEQVMINLIKNSVEAIQIDKEKKRIAISTEINKNMIIVHLKDTGNGIPRGNWDSIFDPFMSFKERGMGLGLPFVKKVMIEHLGNIFVVESSYEGTHFQLEFPQNGILNM